MHGRPILVHMQFGVYCANFGYLGEARPLIDLAVLAEECGWDGFFVYDHVIPFPGHAVSSVDPWTVLAVVAERTELTLGPMITPVARRRPWELAHQAAGVDRLSGGRLVLGVGLGGAFDFEAFGDTSTEIERGDRLDEGLSLLRRLWTGEEVHHTGAWRLAGARLTPTPAGPVPIWVAARYGSRRPLRRAARFDGFFPINTTWDPANLLTPAQLAEMLAVIRAHRGDLDGFEVVAAGYTESSSRETAARLIAPYAEVGATWWFETLEPPRGDLDELRKRIRMGPPQLF
jgi:alkanesulfonate monooxygenase SsuD/methylene tetrahydromethanopterin reductase-like flavin-dependent oxidoreductase (luciferase family)